VSCQHQDSVAITLQRIALNIQCLALSAENDSFIVFEIGKCPIKQDAFPDGRDGCHLLGSAEPPPARARRSWSHGSARTRTLAEYGRTDGLTDFVNRFIEPYEAGNHLSICLKERGSTKEKRVKSHEAHVNIIIHSLRHRKHTPSPFQRTTC
jgi:hypothetical protein